MRICKLVTLLYILVMWEYMMEVAELLKLRVQELE